MTQFGGTFRRITTLSNAEAGPWNKSERKKRNWKGLSSFSFIQSKSLPLICLFATMIRRVFGLFVLYFVYHFAVTWRETFRSLDILTSQKCNAQATCAIIIMVTALGMEDGFRFGWTNVCPFFASESPGKYTIHGLSSSHRWNSSQMINSAVLWQWLLTQEAVSFASCNPSPMTRENLAHGSHEFKLFRNCISSTQIRLKYFYIFHCVSQLIY